jgi:hypothetical protein
VDELMGILGARETKNIERRVIIQPREVQHA